MSKLSKRASANFAIWRPSKIAFAIDPWTLEEAMDGKARVPRKVMGWVIKRENWHRAEFDGNNPSKIEHVLGDDPDNAEDSLQLLGIATRDWEYDPSDTETVRRQLASWVVNEIQGDNTSARLAKWTIFEIERCKADEASIDWPKGMRRE